MADDQDSAGRRLVETGQEIAGSVGGAAIGMLVGGAGGALAGAAAGPALAATLHWAVDEVGRRLLGRREAARAGAVAIYATHRLADLLSDGATIRDDGFFEDDPSGRNSGREIAEGVLLAARDSFEERKIPHLGYLLANLAVHDELDAPAGAMALQTAQGLTWRQYVMLAAVGRGEENPLPSGELYDNPGNWNAWAARKELQQLFDAGFIAGPKKKTEHLELDLINLAVPEQRLAHYGKLLHALLSLDKITDADIEEVHSYLRAGQTSDA